MKAYLLFPHTALGSESTAAIKPGKNPCPPEKGRERGEKRGEQVVGLQGKYGGGAHGKLKDQRQGKRPAEVEGVGDQSYHLREVNVFEGKNRCTRPIRKGCEKH